MLANFFPLRCTEPMTKSSSSPARSRSARSKLSWASPSSAPRRRVIRSPHSAWASWNCRRDSSQSKSSRGARVPQWMVSTWSVMHSSRRPCRTAASAAWAMVWCPSGEQVEWT